MRLTNAMMTNTTLMHINRNMRQLDAIVRQIETGQRASRPSDNPLVASRALQFRTSVLENEQHLANLDQGVAWMNITEATFTNINAQIMKELLVLTNNGASGHNNLQGQQVIVDQMRSLFLEIGNSVNHTFAGQYLFSGFRTNEPPTFRTDNQRSFVITQNFQLRDISREQSFQRIANPANSGLVEPVINDVAVLKLAFAQMDTTPLREPAGPDLRPPVTDPPPDITWQRHVDAPAGIHVPGFHIRKVSIRDPLAYTPPHMSNDLTTDPVGPSAGSVPTDPPLPVLHLIAETGELVMHPDTAANFPREGISITYQKTGFRKGDINPSVYFTSREIINPALPGATLPGGVTVPQVNTVYQITQYLNRSAGTAYPSTGAPQYFDFTLLYPVAFAGQDGSGAFNAPETALHPQLPVGATFTPGPPATIRVPAHVFATHTNVSVTYSTSIPFSAITGSPPSHPIPGGPLVQGDGTPITHIKQDPRIAGVTLVRAHDLTGVPVRLETVDLNRSFDMHNQAIRYEVATRTLVQVNSLAKDLLTDKMFADFRRFFQFADSLHITSEIELEQHFRDLGYEGEALARAVSEQLVYEESAAVSSMYTKFNNMLLLLNRHATQATREQTQLGARMVRMELIQDRLEQDEVSYYRLRSDNENTDLVRATILRMSAEAAFMASLRANSGIVQMSLANFMR